MAFLLLLKFVSWERASYSDSAAREKGNPEPLTHFSNSTSHSQCLGFGFSAHESALWRGMPCFNKNLTLYFPVCCCCCGRYPVRDQEQGEAAFWIYSGSYSGGSQFHHDKYCRKTWGFFGFQTSLCNMHWDEKSVTTCTLTFFEMSEKNGGRNPQDSKSSWL